MTDRHYAMGHDAKVASRHKNPGENPFSALKRLKAQYGTMSNAQEALERD